MCGLENDVDFEVEEDVEAIHGTILVLDDEYAFEEELDLWEEYGFYYVEEEFYRSIQ